MYLLSTFLTHDLFLFSTYITTKKKVAAAIVVAVLVVGAVIWLVRWRRTRASRTA